MFKQKTAYEMRISDWSSDVCSSDLAAIGGSKAGPPQSTTLRGGLYAPQSVAPAFAPSQHLALGAGDAGFDPAPGDGLRPRHRRRDRLYLVAGGGGERGGRL